jgi:hypothetical protein
MDCIVATKYVATRLKGSCFLFECVRRNLPCLIVEHTPGVFAIYDGIEQVICHGFFIFISDLK